MRHLLILLCLGSVGLGGCADKGRDHSVEKPEGRPAAPLIPPEQLPTALATLSDQIQRQVALAAQALEDRESTNAIRRQTLRWRLRIADVCRQARARDNAMAGLVELWFWTLASERFFTTGSGKDQFGEHQALVIERVTGLVASTEQMVRRAVPPDRFDDLKRQVQASVVQGDGYLAGTSTEINPIGSLLEVTKLESVLDLALSPFGAFGGVKEGGDAAARLSVTADRAVDLLAEYPQLLDWHIQAAALEMQGQDAMQALLTELKRTNASVEAAIAMASGLPAQIRSEGVALLDQSRPAQADVRETLRALTDAATALERLNTGVDQLIARFTPAEGAATSEPATAGRPFDIREYTDALNAAALTARDLQQTLAATDHLIASPAIPGRIAEANQTARGLITYIGIWSIALLAALTACIVIGTRLLRR